MSSSGLAWHTDETTLRTKFEEFGPVQEAVSFFFPLLLKKKNILVDALLSRSS
jgi:hypothetical protein